MEHYEEDYEITFENVDATKTFGYICTDDESSPLKYMTPELYAEFAMVQAENKGGITQVNEDGVVKVPCAGDLQMPQWIGAIFLLDDVTTAVTKVLWQLQ